jgi:hypothetical protein
MMMVQTRDFVDMAARCRDFGCRVPVRLAFLPANFSTAANVGEFHYHAAIPHIRSAWQSVGLEDEGPRAPQADANAESAKVPLVAFFGAGLLTGPEWCLTVALGLVSRVLALHPDCASPRDVQFDAVVELQDGQGYACLEYHGDAYGLVALAREVRLIWAHWEPGVPGAVAEWRSDLSSSSRRSK